MTKSGDMAATGGNPMMGFYGEMPDSYNVVLNTANPLVADVLTKAEAACTDKVAPIAAEIADNEAQRKPLDDKKYDDRTDDDKKTLETLNKRIGELRDQKKAVYGEFAATEPHIKQLIDLALLANNMLKGKELADFVKRSVDLLK